MRPAQKGAIPTATEPDCPGPPPPGGPPGADVGGVSRPAGPPAFSFAPGQVERQPAEGARTARRRPNSMTAKRPVAAVSRSRTTAEAGLQVLSSPDGGSVLERHEQVPRSPARARNADWLALSRGARDRTRPAACSTAVRSTCAVRSWLSPMFRRDGAGSGARRRRGGGCRARDRRGESRVPIVDQEPRGRAEDRSSPWRARHRLRAHPRAAWPGASRAATFWFERLERAGARTHGSPVTGGPAGRRPSRRTNDSRIAPSSDPPTTRWTGRASRTSFGTIAPSMGSPRSSSSTSAAPDRPVHPGLPLTVRTRARRSDTGLACLSGDPDGQGPRGCRPRGRPYRHRTRGQTNRAGRPSRSHTSSTFAATAQPKIGCDSGRSGRPRPARTRACRWRSSRGSVRRVRTP